MSKFSPEIFNNLDCEEGLAMLARLKGIPLSQVQNRNLSQIKEKVEFVMAVYMSLDDLSTNKRTRDVMALQETGGLSAVVAKIFDYISEHPEKYLIDFFYHLSLFLSLQTLSGYLIDGMLLNGENATKWFFQHRQTKQDEFLSTLYQEKVKEGSVLIQMPEGDAGAEAFPCTISHGAKFYQMTGGYTQEETPLTDEHAVTILASPDLTVEEIPHTKLGEWLSTLYGEEATQLLSDEAKTIAAARVTHTENGTSFMAVMAHPKSFGSYKDLARNASQMRLVHWIKDYCFLQGWKTTVLGDFNTPIQAPPGTLKMTQEQLDALPLAQLEGWFWTCLRKLGLTSKTATVTAGLYQPNFNQEHIPSIQRKADFKLNTQVFRGKYDIRQYLRDYIMSNWGCEHSPELEIYPKCQHTPTIPTVGRATSEMAPERECWTSDHPLVTVKHQEGDWNLAMCVFNRLADSSLGKDNGPEDMAGYQHDANELFAELYHCLTTPEE